MGGYGMRLRDGSCQSLGASQGNRMRQSASVSGPGLFTRFMTGADPANRPSTLSGTDELLSRIKDLQRQIDGLKDQSGK